MEDQRLDETANEVMKAHSSPMLRRPQSIREPSFEVSLGEDPEPELKKDDAVVSSSTNGDEKEESARTENSKVEPEGELSIEDLVAPDKTNAPSTPAKAAETTMESIQHEVGHLSGEYPCSYNHISGTLYAGTEGFTFKGTIFFYNCHFNVKWSVISQVFQTNLGHIKILAKDVRESQYTFSNLHQADRVWATLVSLHAEFLKGTPNKEPMLGPVRASLRRLSTEPIPITDAAGTPGGTEAAYVAAATVASMDDLRSLSASRRQLVPPTPTAEDPTSDLEEAWTQLYESPDESFKENAFVDQQVACSINQFYDLFFIDDAPHSFGNFMEECGDMEVLTSQWKKEDDNLSRTIEYSHPINAPLAPPKARARKEQRMRRFGDRGISLETDTYVDDVPMTDCFYVSDRILVSANEDGKTVTVSAYFDIRFVKSTMFRAIIANTTRSEFLKCFQAFLASIRRDSPSPADDGTAPAVEIIIKPEAARRTSILSMPPAIAESQDTTKMLMGLLALVLLFQVYIMNQMHGMNRAMYAIQQQQAEVCVLPQVVKNAVLNAKECEEVIHDVEVAHAKEEL